MSIFIQDNGTSYSAKLISVNFTKKKFQGYKINRMVPSSTDINTINKKTTKKTCDALLKDIATRMENNIQRKVERGKLIVTE